MLTIRNILFPTDFSECAEQAFLHADHVARHFSAALHVLNVVKSYEEVPSHPMDHFHLEREDVATWTDARMPKDDREAVRTIHARAREESPAMGILHYANQHDVDLIVMGTHGRRGLGRLLTASVAEEVVRHAHCPVYTIRKPAPETSFHDFRRFLVPIDFSESSAMSVAYAKELAAVYGGRLDLLHVVEEAALITSYGVDPEAVAVPRLLAKARERLRELAALVPGPEVSLDAHVVVGQAAHAIVEFATVHASDIILIATHGVTGLKRLFLGSATEKVLRGTPIPVFVVKSFGKSLIGECNPGMLTPSTDYF
jgi:nucleotide-binding universal stress UspA family protein